MAFLCERLGGSLGLAFAGAVSTLAGLARFREEGGKSAPGLEGGLGGLAGFNGTTPPAHCGLGELAGGLATLGCGLTNVGGGV